jgi:hypothetical protein
MATWEEIIHEIESRLQVLAKSDGQISIGFSWDDGRNQQVNMSRVNFIGESLALITSPVVPYSREAADFLLDNYSLPIVKTEEDGYLSIIHPLHVDHMPVSVCIQAIISIAESADEIEKSMLNGGDGHTGSIAKEESEETEEENSAVIPAGQYVVGTDVAPGLYRFAGYVARLDSEMEVITNESVRSGLGLVRVLEHDSYFEISGEAIRVEDYPRYDVMENAPRGGIYLVGVDIMAGRYRIHGEGRSAYYATYDRQMNRTGNDLNKGSLILNLSPSVFALEFTGRIEKM